jgi:AraC-like DNA-binding protein
MDQARTAADFVLQPVGRISLGANHLLWCHSASLCGSVHWGRYSPEAIADLIDRLAFSQHPALAGGFDVLMNAQAVEGLDWPAWERLARHVRDQLPVWDRRIRRQAIVVPRGIVGGILAGMLPMLRPGYPFRFFFSLADAVAWLERPELPAVLDEVGAFAEAARSVSPAVQQLRAWLDHTLTDVSIGAAARALRLSVRTLQRALRDEGTSFSGELTEARVRAARRRLEQGDENIDVIARRVGCNSSSRLASVFSRHVGETPQQYRRRKQAGDG